MAEISKIKLPSGNEYDIKDAIARQMISGGVSFNIVWTQTDYASSTAPTNDKLATIPAGVSVYYNNGASSSTGTLVASDSTSGQFYLIYSKTQSGTLDMFDEYVTITNGNVKSWEKIGDTLIDLSGLVTNVTLNKSTDTVIGSDATFTVTQPTITLATDASSGTGKVQVATGVSNTTKYLSATATGGGAAWNSKDAKTALTGVKTNNTNVKATASGGGAAWNSKDAKTVLTSVTATQSNLATSTVTGVQASTTTASKATAATTQTTATGGSNASTTNTDWLKGISVSSECLTFGAATMATQSTTQFTFSNVTVPIKNTSATTVATGQLVASGGGATIATNVSSNTASVIGSSATFTNTQPTIALASGAAAGDGVISLAYSAAANGTASVIGSSATFTNTQPTVSLAQNDSTATGRAAVLTGSTATTTYIKATAASGNVAWNSKDQVTVLTSSTSITVTKGE